MLDALFGELNGLQAVIASATATAVFATIVVLAKPLVAQDELKKRVRSVSSERERIKQRERARLVNKNGGEKGSLRHAGIDNQSVANRVVKKLNLKDAFDDGSLTMKLAQAGYRGQKPAVIFLFARFCLPIILLVLSAFYIFSLGLLADYPFFARVTACLVAAYLGFVLPNLILQSQTQKRQQSIQKAFPDSLDLLLICVESGMSIEAAFKRVAQEVGTSSPPLAEELSLTTAELSFLEKRTQAYDNLADRTGLDGVKACALALTQAEKVGTPIASALRVMAQENRDLRMNKAEHKAASLPPKLTVPMILFFLPVLFMIIIAPAIIQLYENDIF